MSYGDCSVTAGRPKGHRTTTRRNARGGRPSCRSTSLRSSSLTLRQRTVQLPPERDPLDDEQALPRLDEPEAARLAGQRRLARDRGQSAAKAIALAPEGSHLRGAAG